MLNKEYEEAQAHHEHHAGCSHDSGNDTQTEGHVPRSTGSKIFRLNKIIDDLRERLPVNAEAPSEDITIPNSEEVHFAEYSLVRDVLSHQNQDSVR